MTPLKSLKDKLILNGNCFLIEVKYFGCLRLGSNNKLLRLHFQILSRFLTCFSHQKELLRRFFNGKQVNKKQLPGFPITPTHKKKEC